MTDADWLTTLTCDCGHTTTGLRTENLPCHTCLHDETRPHTCPLTPPAEEP